MANETRKILGQGNPGAVLTPLYVVPAATQAVVSSVLVCNQNVSDATFRLSVAIAGAANAAQQYLYYEVELPAYNTFAATVGATLGPGDVIRCYASAAGVSFNAFGVEIA